MADALKGVWSQNHHDGYTSSDTETESESEISSIYGFDKSGVVRPSMSLNVAGGGGKNGSESERRCPRAQASKKRNGEERLPTRRPDPRVLNRNALLARENRRKKKLYLESVESELHDARKANRALVKALKRQVKLTQRLEQEKRYFQKILASQTEISNLIPTLNKGRKVSIDQQSTSSWEAFSESPTNNREQLTSYCSSSSYDPESLQSPFTTTSHGSVTDYGINDFSDFLSLDFSTIPELTDLDTDMTGSYSPSSWDDIWNATTTTAQMEETTQYPQITTLGNDNYNSNSIEDHNYVASPDSGLALDMPALSSESSSLASPGDVTDEFNGVCLHLTPGKVSLEFCPICHLNSSSPDPPLQLLNDEVFSLC